MNDLRPEVQRLIEYYRALLDMAAYTPITVENREQEVGRMAAYHSLINSLQTGRDPPELLGMCKAFRVTEENGEWTVGEQSGIFQVYQHAGETFAFLTGEGKEQYETQSENDSSH